MAVVKENTGNRYQRSFSLAGLTSQSMWRHLIQIVVFIFLNGKLFGLPSTKIIVPFLHETQSPWSTAVGAYEALEYTLSQGFAPFLALGVIYLTAVTVGKALCGWACPFGMVQDFLSYAPISKRRLTASQVSQLRDIKWALILFSLLTATLVGMRRSGDPDDDPTGAFTVAPFSALSPSSTLFAFLPWMLIKNPTALLTFSSLVMYLKVSLCALTVVACIFVPRFFCRFLCPMGGLLEILSKFKKLKIKRSNTSAVATAELNKTLADICPTGVEVGVNEQYIESPACVSCGRCVSQSGGALKQVVA